MGYGLTLLTAPTREPVSTGEAKNYLKVDHADDNELIGELVAAARDMAETITMRQLITSTWILTLDRFRHGPQERYDGGAYGSIRDWPFIDDFEWLNPRAHQIRLPLPPCQSVTSLQFLDYTNVVTTIDPSQYRVDYTTEPARLTPAFGTFWPWPLPEMACVRVTFVAGYGNPDAVPAGLKIATKMMVADWYENREAPGEISAGARSILSAFEIGEYV